MRLPVGIVLYDGFSLLDLAAPYEILANASRRGDEDHALFDLFTVGRSKDLITAAGGIQVLPTHIYPDAHVYSVLLVPGGPGCLDATKNLRLMNWFSRAAKLAKIIAAVGSGIHILAVSGVLEGQKVAQVRDLEGKVTGAQLVRQKGVIQDGKLLTVSDSDQGRELGRVIVSEMNVR